jgi:hypothetical protein
MSDTAGTVETILLEAARMLAPLERELAPGRARATFAQLGIPLTGAQEVAISSPLAAAAGDVRDLVQLAAELLAAVEADDMAAVLSKSIAVSEKVAAVVASIDGARTAVQGLGLPIPQATVDAIPERLFNLLLVRALEAADGVNELLELLGILERHRFNDASTDPDDPPFTVSTLRFDRVGTWLESPATALRDLYKWDDPAFTGVELLERLAGLMTVLGAPVFFDGSAVPPRLDAVLVEITPKTDVAPAGLAARLRTDLGRGAFSFAQDDWRIELGLGFTLPFTSELVVSPAGITLIPPSPASTYAGDATFSFVADRTGATEGYVLLGQAEGSRLEVRKLALELGGGFTWDGARAHATLDASGAVSGGKLAISFSEADGFIGKILSGVHLESEFDFGLGYSTEHGLYFVGSSSLAIQLPLHLDLGPVQIDALTLSVGIQGQTFPAALAVDIKAALGPLEAVVEQIGLAVDVALKDDRSGNAGLVDIALGFKPPRGAGLRVDTGLVAGGGFLAYDPATGEYAGVAELSIAGIVTVKAVGLISTRMPDGSQGFSLLIVISGEFTPIQLGFGFVLTGVGGLLGLNRSARLDVLRDGVRTGAVSSVLFPTDVVANAPRLISDLRTIFPPHEGTFLIGPMAKLGWGTPPLVTLSLGVIVEIPPGNVAILGVLRVSLPHEDVALIRLQVNFVGTLELDRQLLAFDASLFDSHVVFVPLAGDMAVRVKWGDNAAFLVSVGGFHPAFQPPPLDLPALRRVSVNLLDYGWARIRVEGYFAVTSNTVQFGAHVHVFFGVDGCEVSGHLGLDVLFQFSPFHFTALITGSVNLEVLGVDAFSVKLRLTLEGPTPYHALGSAGVSFFFFSVDVDFSVTWGEERNTSLPPVAVLPIVVGELGKQENWNALAPAFSNLLVSLRKLDPALSVLHPRGALRVSQRAIPLDVTLDTFGSQRPADVRRVDITAAASGGSAYPLTPVDESFAPAQFQQLTDAEKLSRPSYQQLKGGVTIGNAGGPQSSTMSRRRIAYDVTIIDKEPVRPPARIKAFPGLFDSFLAGAAVARSSLSAHAKSQLVPYGDKIAVGPEGFTVATTRDNKPFDTESTFASEAMAADYLQRQLATDESLAGSLHVLPSYEVNRS